MTFGAKLTAVVVVMLEVGVLVSDLTLSLSIQKKLKLKTVPEKVGIYRKLLFWRFLKVIVCYNELAQTITS